jgi:tyrosyl-tRNA synthetase
MISKDSVRQRIDREGEGISFAEFSYMLLQSYDFAELNRRYGCTLQIGGSDQWGNITGGIDLCRRQNRSAVHALTFPLVTKADGSKFGKTESGTVWLDPSRTSPYAFYQFWISTSDADVYRFLNLFTFLDPGEVNRIREEDVATGGKPSAQPLLAQEVTKLVHGEAGLASAKRITDALFAGTHTLLGEEDFRQLLLDGIPSSRLCDQDLHKPLTSLLTEAGMVGSGKQVKDALARQSLLINGEPCGTEDNMRTAARLAPDRAVFGRYFLARLGKKNHHLFWR